MVRMALTALLTASPLLAASMEDWRAIFSVSLALSAFWRILAAISSIELEASSLEAACSETPWDRVSALALSSSLPAETFSAAEDTSVTTSRRR